MKRWIILEKVHIESMWFWGVWIATHESGRKLLIKGGLPGSIVDCKVVKKKRDYAECHIVTVHSMDEKWLDGGVKCPHYVFPYWDLAAWVPEHKSGCGWCKWQSVSYEKQMDLKWWIVDDSFRGIQWMEKVEVFPMIPSPLQFKYRNKIEYSFGKYLRKDPDGDGFAVAEHWNAWFHKQWQFSKVVDVDQCYLVSDRMHAVYERLKWDLRDSGLPVYDAKRHDWFLRHLVVREWVRTNQLLVNMSIASAWFETHGEHQKIWDKLVSTWRKDEELMSLVTTLVLTHNNWLADIVRGKDSTLEVLRGEWIIFEWLRTWETDEWLVRFQVSPFSFFQTNTTGAEVLFKRAAEMVGHVGWNLIDLYCGSGSIGIMFHSLGIWKKIHGIDIVESSIKDAHKNAEINGVSDKALYYCGKAEKLVQEWIIDEKCFVWDDLIVVDPPRQWLHKDMVDFLISLRKKFGGCKLLYISCNPVTMARDVELLIEWGYVFKQLQTVDMFPHTPHIESIWIFG